MLSTLLKSRLQVGVATLDLLPLLSGAVQCGGEVLVVMRAAADQAPTEPGQVCACCTIKVQ
jgi:hypothetical protein